MPHEPEAHLQSLRERFLLLVKTERPRLRYGRLSEIDIEHIAEELEDMGKSEQRALANDLHNLLLHLLRWKYQPGLRGASWDLSFSNSRDAINDILADSPSLQPGLPALIDKMYPRARKAARIETGLPDSLFPYVCPFSQEDVLTEDFQVDNQTHAENDLP